MKNFKFRWRTKLRDKIKLNQRVVDFNKEILIGEAGALLGAPIFGFLSSLISRSPNFVSFSTLLGSIIGASSSWLIARVQDEKKRGKLSRKKIAKDLSLYTPIAFLIALLAAYPTVVLVTHSLFIRERISYLSSFVGELCGFVVFLILINAYRYLLSHKMNKIL